jgi:hypothetical protein
MAVKDYLDIPELLIELYRNDDAVKRILLTTTVGTITATSGSASVTVSDSASLAVGYNLYQTDGTAIGTVASVGSGTATLTSVAPDTYSGVLKVGIGWETAVTDAVCDLVRNGTGTAVISLSLGSGITLDGDWMELDFTSLLTTVRADRYVGDVRVELVDGSYVTLIIISVATLIQNRSSF